MERTSNGLLLQGIFTLLFGIAAIFWPGLTLVTFVYLFSAYILLSGVVTLITGIGSLVGSGKAILTRFLTLLFGVIQIGVGVYLVRHLDVGFATLILLVGFTFIIRGIFDVVTGLFEEGPSGYRLITILIGIVATLAGIMILFQPVAGGVAFVWILGIYSLVAGPLLITAAMAENQTPSVNKPIKKLYALGNSHKQTGAIRISAIVLIVNKSARMAMGRRKKIILWAVGTVVVLGGLVVAFGPYVYRDLTTKDNPMSPTVNVTDSMGESLSDISGTWRVANGSYAGYRVDEVLRGVETTVVGRTQQVTGELTVNGTTVSAGNISIDMASVATNISARDNYFREDTMHTSEYPNATFELTSPIEVSTPLVAGEKKSFEVKGKLTIHGVTREVTTQLEMGFDGKNVQIAGSIPVTFADYGVKAPDLGFVTVEPSGHIELLIKFER